MLICNACIIKFCKSKELKLIFFQNTKLEPFSLKKIDYNLFMFALFLFSKDTS